MKSDFFFHFFYNAKPKSVRMNMMRVM